MDGTAPSIVMVYLRSLPKAIMATHSAMTPNAVHIDMALIVSSSPTMTYPTDASAGSA